MVYTILLADDDKDALQYNLQALKKLNRDYRVLGAPDGDTAWNLIKSRKPDLAIVDWMMPGLSGLELLRLVRKEPTLAHMPVIMVTALTGASDLKQAFDAGVTDYLRKPYDEIEFLSRTRAALQAHRLFLENEQQQIRLKSLNRQLLQAQHRLTELNTLKDVFLSVISSDLNEPLVSLTAFVNLLFKNLDNFSKEEMKYVSENVRGSLIGVSSLMNNLIRWSKMETDYQTAELQQVKLINMLAEVILQVEEERSLKQIKFLDLPQKNVEIAADPDMLMLMLQTFLSSSMRFTEKGGHIGFKLKSGEGSLVLQVEFDGLRIHEHQRDQLFQLDYYLENHINPYEKGAGLGFVICEKLMEKAGGSIALEVFPQKKARFDLCFPTF